MLKDTFIAVLDRRPIIFDDGGLHLTLDHQNRLRLAAEVMGREQAAGREAFLLLCGKGRQPHPGFPTTSRVAKNWVNAELGVSEDSIVLEEYSLDTVGNLIFARAIIDSMWANIGHLVLVTSKFHHNRVYQLSKRIFRGSFYVVSVVACNDPRDGFGLRSLDAEEQSLLRALGWLDRISTVNVRTLLVALRNHHRLYR